MRKESGDGGAFYSLGVGEEATILSHVAYILFTRYSLMVHFVCSALYFSGDHLSSHQQVTCGGAQNINKRRISSGRRSRRRHKAAWRHQGASGGHIWRKRRRRGRSAQRRSGATLRTLHLFACFRITRRAQSIFATRRAFFSGADMAPYLYLPHSALRSAQTYARHRRAACLCARQHRGAGVSLSLFALPAVELRQRQHRRRRHRNTSNKRVIARDAVHSHCGTSRTHRAAARCLWRANLVKASVRRCASRKTSSPLFCG